MKVCAYCGPGGHNEQTCPFVNHDNTENQQQYELVAAKRRRGQVPVGGLEIADRLGVQRRTVAMWKQRDLLPPARWTVSGEDAWDWAEDILPWAERTRRWPPRRELGTPS